MALNYLLDPMFQIENTAGKPATDGWLEVYVHGTRTKYYCASNFDGTLHPFKIKLDSLGSNIVLADDGQAYDVYAYNRFGSLLMSRYNVQPGKGGSGSGGLVSELQHWLGGYGPSYTPFPGDDIGHTLGISTGRLQGSGEVDYVGDFIDRIETCPYPDGVYDGYIYLKPGLYYIDCIIRYQQASDSLSNTLDEVLVYTGYGNANESLAYQFDSTGPEATGNRHNVRVSFVRHVTENEGSILYFAPATPVNWKEAYIQKLQIVKLDSVAVSHTIVQGLEKVHHDGTLVGDGTVANPLGVDSDSVQKKLNPGDGLVIDSDGTIHIDNSVYQEKLTAGEHIDIDSDNVIKTVGLQKELTAGTGIELDSDGNISVDTDSIPSEPVDFTPLVAGHGITIEDSDGETVISATGEVYTSGYGIIIDSDNEISVDPSVIQKKLTEGDGIELDSDGNISVDPEILPEMPPILPLVAGENVTIEDSDGVVVISADGGESYSAGEGIDIDSDGVISVDSDAIPSEPVDFSPLIAGDNITLEESGGSIVISTTGGGQSYTAGENIEIDSDNVISAPDVQKKLTAGNGIALNSDGVISSGNLFVATFNVTPFDDIKAAIDAGKAVIARSGRIQYSVCSTETELWGAPCIFFETIIDQYQAGFPARSLVACRRISDSQTEWRGMGGGELALQSNVNSALNAKQDKLTAGENITIDSDGVISAAGGGGETYTAGSGINIDSDGEVSVKTGSGVTIDSDGALSAELPEEEPVQFEEFDDSEFATKAELADKADSATTLAGYGITDAYTKTEVGNALANKADSATTLAGYGITDAYTKTEVGNALANKADSATTLAGYGITDAYTKTEVGNALNDKQNTLTGITDVQVVAALPASPVATVLYLIPEA